MSDKRQFYPLYLTRFAGSFGHITVLTLLPTYIDILDPSGFVVGLFVTALQVASTAAVVPLGWAGGRETDPGTPFLLEPRLRPCPASTVTKSAASTSARRPGVATTGATST